MTKRKINKRPRSLIDQACDAIGVTRAVYNGAIAQLKEGKRPLEGVRLAVLEKYKELQDDAKERTAELQELSRR